MRGKVIELLRHKISIILFFAACFSPVCSVRTPNADGIKRSCFLHAPEKIPLLNDLHPVFYDNNIIEYRHQAGIWTATIAGPAWPAIWAKLNIRSVFQLNDVIYKIDECLVKDWIEIQDGGALRHEGYIPKLEFLLITDREFIGEVVGTIELTRGGERQVLQLGKQ